MEDDGFEYYGLKADVKEVEEKTMDLVMGYSKGITNGV